MLVSVLMSLLVFQVKQEDHFLETYQFLNELEISYLHVFTYSERENTLAASLPQSIPMKERNERSRMLHILSDKKRRVFYEDNLNKSFTVLFENDVEDGLMHGFTENYIRVAAKYDPLLINETKPVILTSINSKGQVEVEELVDNSQLTMTHT
jgi:threonylcarbamoyladenosine tRNA methylthiotransferase MtaB